MAKQYRRPHRYKKRKPIYRSIVLWSAVFSLILAYAVFYLLVLAGFSQVKEARVTGLPEDLQNNLKFSVQEMIGSSVLSFPTRSIFLLDTGKMEREMFERFPCLATIKIQYDFPSSLNVKAVKREGLATFCQAGDCFAIDKEGIAFEVGDYLSPFIRTLIFTGEIKLGDKVISREELKQLLEINSYLERDLGIALKEILISPSGNLNVLTQEGWEIYLNLGEETEWQLTKLKLLLDEKIPIRKRGDLEWIELRFGNFANPKYKD